MKTKEFKRMMGRRKMDSDGFTYVYGAVKDCSSVRPATASTKRSVRADKRRVRNQELRRMLKESM